MTTILEAAGLPAPEKPEEKRRRYPPLNPPSVQMARRNAPADSLSRRLETLFSRAESGRCRVARKRRTDAAAGDYYEVRLPGDRGAVTVWGHSRFQDEHWREAAEFGTMIIRAQDKGSVNTQWGKHVCPLIDASLTLDAPLGAGTLGDYWANWWGEDEETVHDLTVVSLRSLRFLHSLLGYGHGFRARYEPTPEQLEDPDSQARAYDVTFRIPRLVTDVERGAFGSHSFLFRPHLLDVRHRRELREAGHTGLVHASTFTPGAARASLLAGV